MIDYQIIAERMLELGENAAGFNAATKEESERTGADLGEVRLQMLSWIEKHAIFTAAGGWSLKPALEKFRKGA